LIEEREIKREEKREKTAHLSYWGDDREEDQPKIIRAF
jgi:hypothetical protein